MALNTEISSPDADSMITLEEMNALVRELFAEDEASEWYEYSESTQEDMIRLGAMFFTYFPLRGEPAVATQAMPFPRDYQTDLTVIPPEIKETQAGVTLNVILRAYKTQTPLASGATSAAQVKKIDLGGLLGIEFNQFSDSTGSMMEQFVRATNGLIWLRLRKHLTRFRGAVI